MSSERRIRTVAERADRWLLNRQAKHVAMVEKSIEKLQSSIINDIQLLATSNGRLEGIKVNLKQAQKIHKKVVQIFDGQFSRDMQAVVNDFKAVESLIESSYRYLGESVKFTSLDRATMDVLRDGYWRDYLAIGGQKQNAIIQSVYDQVISGGQFSGLVSTIEQQLLGTNVAGVVGRPLAQYARLYARDMIMNFHQEVNTKKAEDIGIKHFLYIGDIIATTRQFCRTRVGKYYTKNQIQSWTYRWAGKSGPAFTHRGGWNCRHHWQPIRPEWLKGKKKLDVADWNLEQRSGG